MKNLKLILILFYLFSFLACDNNNSDDEQFCQLDEFMENVANSECLAEELLAGCSNVDCSGSNPSTSVNLLSCSFVDCETLSCESISFVNINQSIDQPGLMAEISIDELTGLPAGIFVLEDLENDFKCGILQN